MRGRTVSFAVAVSFALLVGLVSCDNQAPANGPAKDESLGDPSAKPPPAETESKAEASQQDNTGDWPPIEPEEDSLLATGIVGQIISRAPPTLPEAPNSMALFCGAWPVLISFVI